MAQTISMASFQDLSMGNTKILLIPQVDAISASSYETANELYSTKDSFNLKEGTPSETDIYLDQGNMLLTTITLSQKTVLKATLPTNAIEIFDQFYTNIPDSTAVSGLTSLTVGGYTYKSHKAYSLTKKMVKATLGIQSASGQTFISLLHAQVYAILNIENVNTKLWSFDLVANVQSFSAGDFIVHKQILTT